MLPVTAGSFVLVAALQNMLLLDLFHNIERKFNVHFYALQELLGAKNVFKEHPIPSTSDWQSDFTKHWVYFKKKNYSLLDSAMFSWVATDYPHPLKKN